MPIAVTSAVPPLRNPVKSVVSIQSPNLLDVNVEVDVRSRASTASPLPAELWEFILSHIPRASLQHTALSLSRAIPNADAVALSQLFTHIRLTRDAQAQQLVRRLGPRFKDASLAKEAAKTFTGLAWRTDSNILVNVIASFPNLREIILNVGPLFAPEHLEELVACDRECLEKLSLRFNPYVDKASYTIFLKGIYFDSGILQLAKWTLTPSLKQLSLVQDPIPSHRDLVAAALEQHTSAPKQAHAQPIVFFKLSCLSSLATSPVAAHISQLRLRVPNRSILTAISTASTSSVVIPATHSAVLPKPFPALQHLDISTTYVNCDAALQGLLKRHPGLTHLVADRSGLLRIGQSEELCKTLGGMVASIGISKATEASKVYRAAMRDAAARRVAQRAADTSINSQHHLQGQQPAANSEIQRLVARDLATTSKRARPSYATERRSRASPALTAPSAASTVSALSSLSLADPTSIKPIILPSAPSLVSLACGPALPASVTDNNNMEEITVLRNQWESDFAEGFKLGLERVCIFIQEKLEEYHRMVSRAQIAQRNTRSSAEDRALPKLFRFRTPSERRVRLAKAAAQGLSMDELDESEADGSRDVIRFMDLVECSEPEVALLVESVRAARCQLCTVADCAGHGRIASTDDAERHQASPAIWKRPASEHTEGCAHLVARDAWDEV